MLFSRVITGQGPQLIGIQNGAPRPLEIFSSKCNLHPSAQITIAATLSINNSLISIEEVKAFHDSKCGVKGLVDSGIAEIPKMFVLPPDEVAEYPKQAHHVQTNLEVPPIDFSGIGSAEERKEIVGQIQHACMNWGFFQVVNHAIPLSVLDGMMEGGRRFHEQDAEVKKQFYSLYYMDKVRFTSNYGLYRARAATWRDTFFTASLAPGTLQPDDIPECCRVTTVDYIDHVTKLGDTVFELLSEALGLKPGYLKELEVATARAFLTHYYPECPQPDLTLGLRKHTDGTFLTILQQDEIGGLQFLHDDQWVDVQPIPGAFVVNVGDLLQFISNDKFKSVIHRVLANGVAPRISVAALFLGAFAPPKIYGPIKELISEESPAVFRDFTVPDYVVKYYGRPVDDKAGFDHMRLSS